MAHINEFEDYRSPFSTRFSSKEMRFNFSEQNKFSTWRRLWILLAKAEMVRKNNIFYLIMHELFYSMNIIYVIINTIFIITRVI